MLEDKNILKIKNIITLETIVIKQVNIELLHILYVNQSIAYLKKLALIFQNESNYDYHFFIRKLAEEFKG